MEGAEVEVPVVCVCCGGPYHPATGGLHGAGLAGVVAFCGPCEREAVKYYAHCMKRTVAIRHGWKKRIPFHA